MTKFSEISAREIGKKFGQSVDDFGKAQSDTLEGVLQDWSNDGIEIMRKVIQAKARTKGASTLAQDMNVQPAKKEGNGVTMAVTTGQLYADFVDKGVQGVMGNKAPNSPYKFKNLGTSDAMVNSFKEYIARTGLTSFQSKGSKKVQLILKNKTKQADRITIAAKQMAVATKIGGIKPMNFIAPAVNDQRKKLLSDGIRAAIGAVLRINIVQSAK